MPTTGVDEFVFRLNDGNVKRLTLDRIDYANGVKPKRVKTVL
jgi:hypothetical protein